MSYQPLPYAKRQKVTGGYRPSLDPEPAREPELYTPTEEFAPRRHHRHQQQRTSAPTQPINSTKPRAYEHGNFQGYYTKRRAEDDGWTQSDARLSLLPPDWFKGKKVLDVGCNAGRVTIQVAQQLGAARVTGVDIDPDLIKTARRQADLAWSRQQPLQHVTDVALELDSTGELLDLPASAPFPPKPEYFPASLPRMFGFLPAPTEILTTYMELPETEVVSASTGRRQRRKLMPVEVRQFPDNIRFVSADWPNEQIEADKRGYDVILALSVTKWIHLHGLNDGLVRFFKRAFECLLPGGVLVLEPQPFSTYQRSTKHSQQLKVNYKVLEGATSTVGTDPEHAANGEQAGQVGTSEQRGWRPEDGDFERVLLDVVGFERVRKMGETGTKGFRRPIEAYFKRHGTWQ